MMKYFKSLQMHLDETATSLGAYITNLFMISRPPFKVARSNTIRDWIPGTTEAAGIDTVKCKT